MSGAGHSVELLLRIHAKCPEAAMRWSGSASRRRSVPDPDIDTDEVKGSNPVTPTTPA